MLKKYSKRKLAQAFLRLRAEKSEEIAIQALAAQLVTQGLTHQVELVVQEISREILLQQQELHVTVTSAHELSANLIEQIAAKIQTQTGAQRLVVAEQQDPEILGGFLATSPAGQIDATVRSRLKQLVT